MYKRQAGEESNHKGIEGMNPKMNLKSGMFNGLPAYACALLLLAAGPETITDRKTAGSFPSGHISLKSSRVTLKYVFPFRQDAKGISGVQR